MSNRQKSPATVLLHTAESKAGKACMPHVPRNVPSCARQAGDAQVCDARLPGQLGPGVLRLDTPLLLCCGRLQAVQLKGDCPLGAHHHQRPPCGLPADLDGRAAGMARKSDAVSP